MISFLDISCKDNDKFLEFNWILWETIAKKLPENIKNGNLRDTINQLPCVNVKDLCGNLNLIRRAYTMFTFIAHGYVRGRLDQEVLKKLPAKISTVWMELGEILGVPPVATYAATVTFNLKFRPCENQRNKTLGPDDFEIEFTFTGTEDEKWFYAISAAIDVHSSSIIQIAKCILIQEDVVVLNVLANNLEKEIKNIISILKRMYEKCRPEIFYNKIRKYLSGWLNDPEIGPDGLTYELLPSENISKCVQLKLAGGSAAQNPTIQLLDVILGVKHGNDSDNLLISEFNYSGCQFRQQLNYLGAMRTYMPREHRNYLNELEKKFGCFKSENFKKTDGYKKCVEALIEFRSEHIKMVTQYVVCQTKTEERIQGTGGSNPIPFLKKCRSETEFCLYK